MPSPDRTTLPHIGHAIMEFRGPAAALAACGGRLLPSVLAVAATPPMLPPRCASRTSTRVASAGTVDGPRPAGQAPEDGNAVSKQADAGARGGRKARRGAGPGGGRPGVACGDPASCPQGRSRGRAVGSPGVCRRSRSGPKPSRRRPDGNRRCGGKEIAGWDLRRNWGRGGWRLRRDSVLRPSGGCGSLGEGAESSRGSAVRAAAARPIEPGEMMEGTVWRVKVVAVGAHSRVSWVVISVRAFSRRRRSGLTRLPDSWVHIASHFRIISRWRCSRRCRTHAVRLRLVDATTRPTAQTTRSTRMMA